MGGRKRGVLRPPPSSDSKKGKNKEGGEKTGRRNGDKTGTLLGTVGVGTMREKHRLHLHKKKTTNKMREEKKFSKVKKVGGGYKKKRLCRHVTQRKKIKTGSVKKNIHANPSRCKKKRRGE